MAESATTYDQRKIHPLIKELQDFFIQVSWIASVGIRMGISPAHMRAAATNTLTSQ